MNKTRNVPFTLLATLCLGLGCAADVDEPDDFDYELLLDEPSEPTPALFEDGRFVDPYEKAGQVRLTFRAELPAGVSAVHLGAADFKMRRCNPLQACEHSPWLSFRRESIAHTVDADESIEFVTFDAYAKSYDQIGFVMPRVVVVDDGGDTHHAELNKKEYVIDAPFDLEAGTVQEFSLQLSAEDALVEGHTGWAFDSEFVVVAESTEDL